MIETDLGLGKVFPPNRPLDPLEEVASAGHMKQRSGSKADFPGPGLISGGEIVDREAAAYLIVGSSAEVGCFSGMAKVLGEAMKSSEELTEEEAAEGCDLLLELAGKVTPNEFHYDCIPTRITDEGEQFDVYVIRGGDEARARFNVRVEQIGGELEDLGEPGLQAVQYAGEVLQRLLAEELGITLPPPVVLADLGLGHWTDEALAGWKQAVAEDKARLLFYVPFRARNVELEAAVQAFKKVADGVPFYSLVTGTERPRKFADQLCKSGKRSKGKSFLIETEGSGGEEAGDVSIRISVSGDFTTQDIDKLNSAIDAAFPGEDVDFDVDLGEEETTAGHKHRSPSDERYRLRHKYGATRTQLERFGVPEELAEYISERVKEKLKSGEGIVDAIENAHKLYAAARKEWDWIDRLNLRIAAELTVPRMVRDGRSQEEAMSLANTTDAFMETGWSLGRAFEEAKFYWNAKSTNNARELKIAKEILRGARFSLFYDELTGKTGPDVWERPSGAHWVAGVAADLCGERNPKTDRLFTLQEAAKQAGTEWQSMTREARLGVRDSYYGTTGGAAWEDEDYFVSTLAKASLIRAHGVDEGVADLIVPMILPHARQGKDLMAAIDAGILDWQGVSKPKSPPPPPGLHEILKLLMDNPAHWMTVLNSQPPAVEEKVVVREEVDLGDYRPMCGCVTCRQSMSKGSES